MIGFIRLLMIRMILIHFHFINQFFDSVNIFTIEILKPPIAKEIESKQTNNHREKQIKRQKSITICFCVWNRFCNYNHFANQKRNKTQIKRKIILFIQFKLMKKIFQRIISSQSRIADFSIKSKELTEEENCNQSHRSHQNLDVKPESERNWEKPNHNQNDRKQNNGRPKLVAHIFSNPFQRMMHLSLFFRRNLRRFGNIFLIPK